MNNSANSTSLRRFLLKRLTVYTQKVAGLGQRVRQLVFGFRLRSTAHIDRWALPVKLLHDHHILQRRQTFHQSGGHRSSIAVHALNKARQHQ